MSTATVSARSAQNGFGRLLLVGLVAGLVAAVVDVIIFFIGSSLGVPFIISMGPGQEQTLNALPFIATSVIPALLAAVFYGLLGRLTKRATTIFVVVAVVFALLSLSGPLLMPVAQSTRLVLALLHLVTAAIITYGLTRYARQGE